jgi:hypothetical protein
MRLERWRYSVPLRVRGLFRRGRLETDLTDEFRDHLERDRAVCNRRRRGRSSTGPLPDGTSTELGLAGRFRATSAAAQVSRIVIRLLLLQPFVR